MKVIDYERTKCYFKVEYEDGYIYSGSINIDETSINNNSQIARLPAQKESCCDLHQKARLSLTHILQ